MDNITHGLAGALMGLGAAHALERARPSPRVRGLCLALGIVTAELPDLDVLYSGSLLGMGKLGYLLHHRGHTHTLVFALLAALAVWRLVLWRRPDLRDPAASRTLLLLTLAGTGSHILLDWTNNYGVHPWWPLDNGWTYGDAVFIVEPWIWVAALPALFMEARTTVGRALCGLLMLGIVGACWRVSLVSSDVAVAVTAGMASWLLAMQRLPAAGRLVAAGVAWLVVETAFFAGTAAARGAVAQAAGAGMMDIAVTPAPGDPLCHRALVVSMAGDRYQLRSAAIAPWPAIRSLASCPTTIRAALDGTPLTSPGTPRVAWDVSWSAPVHELRQLAAGSCEARAALRFIRMPIWRRGAGDTVQLSDARYGEGDGSFASVRVRRGDDCPRLVPPWEPPRRQLLGAP